MSGDLTGALPASMVTNELWGADWPDVRALWALDTTVAYLNHGAFGAVPEPVLDEQRSWRDRMETNPTRFFSRELPGALDEVLAEVAHFLGADADAVAFVDNVTTAVSAVLRSFPIDAGDEVLVTDHVFGGVRIAVDRWSEAVGARVVTAHIPLTADDAAAAAAVSGAVTPRTRLAMIEHITSPTARRLPLVQIIPALQEQQVTVLVDGAHAPGMLDLRLPEVGADFYVGNLHKWGCAPRGTGILYAAPHVRDGLRPLVTSWGERHGFPHAFHDAGTRDPTAWLAAGRAVRTLEHLGLARLRRHNIDLAVAGQRAVAAALDASHDQLPRDPALSMQLVPLPRDYGGTPGSAALIQSALAEQAGIEVAITTWRGQGFVRLSAQAYNAPTDYDRLAAALPGVLSSLPAGAQARAPDDETAHPSRNQ